MSQIFKQATSSTPSIPTSVVTDDGTIVPASNSFDLLGVDSTEDNDNGILTRANPTSSVNGEVVLTNRLQGAASSVNAANADIITFDLGASAAVFRFSFKITGRDTSTDDGVGYSIEASAKTDGAAATVVGIPDVDHDEDASLLDAEIDVIASGNNVILRANGVSGQTVSYKAVATYLVV